MENDMELKISLEAKCQVLAELMESIKKAPDMLFEAAMILTAIRNEFSSNNAFRDELDEQGIAINKDDRAAMIRFGSASQEVQDAIERFMRKEGRISFRKLPAELWESFSHQCDNAPLPGYKSENVEIPHELPQECTTVPTETVKKQPVKKAVPIKASIHGRVRADEVWAIISDWSVAQRKGVNQINKKEGWDLLLECLDLGLFTKEGTGTEKPTARAIVNLPMFKSGGSVAELSKFDLSKPAGCKLVKAHLMPFLRKNAQALIAKPESFVLLWSEEEKAKREAMIKADQEEKYAKAMAEITARGEKEVIVCGIRLWPSKHPNFTSFSYEQLRLAWFMFLDVESLAIKTLGEGNPQSKDGRKERASLHRWLSKNYVLSFAVFADKPGLEEAYKHANYVGLAWLELSYALENGTDDKLQTSIPFTDVKVA